MTEILWNARLVDVRAGVALEGRAITIDDGMVTAISAAGASPDRGDRTRTLARSWDATRSSASGWPGRRSNP